MEEADRPVRVVSAVAPIRICDIGGWTDTWFAGHGKVFNIGVTPLVEVQVAVRPRARQTWPVVLHAKNFGDRYGFELDALPGRHPHFEAAIDEIGVPDDVSIEASIFSEVPPGSSTGTSAATIVALIGALDALTPGRMTPDEVARRAHLIEVDRLGLQSGVQDQLCAAKGSVNYIEISPYPHASVLQLPMTNRFRQNLEEHLMLVYLGRGHTSSRVHDSVIAGLSGAGLHAKPLDALRAAAEVARDAVLGADLGALGEAMRRNTDAQGDLHADLVGQEAQEVIALGRAHGALGWKINGAGGEGGSITLLCGPEKMATHALVQAICSANPMSQLIPIQISERGLQVWERSPC